MVSSIRVKIRFVLNPSYSNCRNLNMEFLNIVDACLWKSIRVNSTWVTSYHFLLSFIPHFFFQPNSHAPGTTPRPHVCLAGNMYLLGAIIDHQTAPSHPIQTSLVNCYFHKIQDFSFRAFITKVNYTCVCSLSFSSNRP